MTLGGVKEYLEAVQGRYLKGARKKKGRILDEATKVTEAQPGASPAADQQNP